MTYKMTKLYTGREFADDKMYEDKKVEISFGKGKKHLGKILHGKRTMMVLYRLPEY